MGALARSQRIHLNHNLIFSAAGCVRYSAGISRCKYKHDAPASEPVWHRTPTALERRVHQYGDRQLLVDIAPRLFTCLRFVFVLQGLFFEVNVSGGASTHRFGCDGYTILVSQQSVIAMSAINGR